MRKILQENSQHITISISINYPPPYKQITVHKAVRIKLYNTDYLYVMAYSPRKNLGWVRQKT